MSAQFLEKNYDRFFERYSQLLNSENYVTKRQALKVSSRSRCLLAYVAYHCVLRTVRLRTRRWRAVQLR